MSTFWRTENKIPIVQTSSAITAENGLEFGENQIIRLDIPKSTKFIQPKESYLKFDFKIKLPAGEGFTRLQLDGKLGAQSLIKNLRIYSSAESGAVLLEEILDYNAMVGVKYSYDADDTVKSKRALTEGSTVWCPTNRGTQGSTKSNMMDTNTNPYFKRIDLVAGAGNSRTSWAQSDFLTVKCCLPLHSGIWSSERVYPNLLTGLRVEIELEEAKKVLKQLDSVLENNKLNCNAEFDSINGSGNVSPNVKGEWSTTVAGENVAITDSFYVKLENSCLDPAHIGFVVGERVNFVHRDTTVAKPTFTQGGVAVDFMTITEINASANASGGGGLLFIKVNAATTITSTDNMGDNYWYMVSKSVSNPTASDYVATYTVSNVEMVVQELDMGAQYESDMLRKMSEGGTIGFDILSVQNYKHSALATDIVLNMRLPIQNSRCRSICCLPTDSTVYTAKATISATGTYDVSGKFGLTPSGDGNFRTNSTQSGLVGISDYLTNYNFFYDGKLQPSRAVSTQKISNKNSINAMPLIENEKALTQGGIPVRSMSDFNTNFGVMRAFSLNRGVEDLRNKDFSLQLNYQGLAPTKNKMWNNYVFHLRQIQIRSGDINVVV